MGKLRIKRKGFGFEICIDGEVSIDTSSIKPYDEYVKEEEAKLLFEQVQQYLNTIMKTCVKKDSEYFSCYQERIGACQARDELANYLVKHLED